MADRPSIHDKPLHHEGWLEKMSPSQVKGWQKRWVVLHGATLKYWKDPDDYRAEKSPKGCIHAHTILSIDAHPDSALEFHIKVLKSRVDIRKYEWRVWCADTRAPASSSAGGSSALMKKKGGAKGQNAVSAEAWNLRVVWLARLDEWSERFLLERIFSRFHVRKPAKFVDEILCLGPAGGEDGDEEDEEKEQEEEMAKNKHKRPQHKHGQPLVSNLESYLDKRSPGLFALWQRRWFVFLEAEDMIVYYKSREEYLHGSEPVGSFQIADLNTVEGIGGLQGRELHIETMTVPEVKRKDREREENEREREREREENPPPSSPSAGNGGGGFGGRKRALSPSGDSSSGLGTVAPPPPVVAAMKIRTYKLRALTTESRDQWVTQLKARINVKSKAAVLKRVQSALRSNSISMMGGATGPTSPSAAASNAGGVGRSSGSISPMGARGGGAGSNLAMLKRMGSSFKGIEEESAAMPSGGGGREESRSRSMTVGAGSAPGFGAAAAAGESRVRSSSISESMTTLSAAASPSLAAANPNLLPRVDSLPSLNLNSPESAPTSPALHASHSDSNLNRENSGNTAGAATTRPTPLVLPSNQDELKEA